MPVDYRLAGLDPWKKYDENRDYLLRRAMLDENIAARESNEELSNRRLALGQQELNLSAERFGEQKSQNKAVREGMADSKKQANAQQFQNMQRQMLSFSANMFNIADEGNWPVIRDKMKPLLYSTVEQSTMDDKQKAAAKKQIDDFIPDEYDKETVDSGLYKLFGEAEKADSEFVFISNPDGSGQEMISIKKGENYQPPQGKVMWKDWSEFKSAGDGYKSSLDMRAKEAGVAKDEANAYYSTVRNFLMPFNQKAGGSGLLSVLDETGNETEEFKNAAKTAVNFYYANRDGYNKLDDEQKMLFKNAEQFVFANNDFLAKASKTPKTGPASDFIGRYLKVGREQFGGGEGEAAKLSVTETSGATEQSKSKPAKQGEAEGTSDRLPRKLSDWNVQILPQNGRSVPFALIKDKDGKTVPVELTEDEYDQWETYQKRQKGGGISFKIPTGTMKLEDRSGILPPQQFPH